MKLTALEISKKLNGIVVGDDKVIIKSLSRIENAKKGMRDLKKLLVNFLELLSTN